MNAEHKLIAHNSTPSFIQHSSLTPSQVSICICEQKSHLMRCLCTLKNDETVFLHKIITSKIYGQAHFSLPDKIFL